VSRPIRYHLYNPYNLKSRRSQRGGGWGMWARVPGPYIDGIRIIDILLFCRFGGYMPGCSVGLYRNTYVSTIVSAWVNAREDYHDVGVLIGLWEP
jgi:hypothetical protein